MTYAEKLKHPKWQKKRLEILNRDKFTCKKCGDEETTLHVHHLRYEKNADPWESSNKDLITLCEDCHKIIEGYKDEGLYSEISIYKCGEWMNDSLIMLTQIGGATLMEVYNKKREKLCGFNFTSWHGDEFVRAFKKFITKSNKFVPQEPQEEENA